MGDMLKVRTKFRLIIFIYMCVPVGITVLFCHGSPVFFDSRFQEAMVLCLFSIFFPIFVPSLLFGINWLFLHQLKQIEKVCLDVKDGNYSLFPVPNEPVEPGNENELIFLMRNMNWMIRRIQVRETELEKRVAQRTKAIQEKNEQLVIARDRANASAKAKSMFLATMSHEIRTPLNAMIGMSDSLIGSSLSAAQKDKALTINTSSKTLLRILNDILEFSKLDAQKMALSPEDTDFWDLLENVNSCFLPQAQEKNIEFFMEIDPKLPAVVTMDGMRLSQILNNLLSNAIKFTLQGQVRFQVEVENLTEDSVRVKFGIRDTGVGIEQENMETLFMPFSQADGSISRKFGGTGLGLAISQEMAALMGGQILLESQVGKGSYFYFTLAFPVISLVREKKDTADKEDGTEDTQASQPEYKEVVLDEHLENMLSHLEELIEQNNLEAKAVSMELAEKLAGTVLENLVEAMNTRIRKFDFSVAHERLQELKIKIADQGTQSLSSLPER